MLREGDDAELQGEFERRAEELRRALERQIESLFLRTLPFRLHGRGYSLCRGVERRSHPAELYLRYDRIQ